MRSRIQRHTGQAPHQWMNLRSSLLTLRLCIISRCCALTLHPWRRMLGAPELAARVITIELGQWAKAQNYNTSLRKTCNCGYHSKALFGASNKIVDIFSSTEASNVACEANLHVAFSDLLRVSSIQLLYTVGLPCRLELNKQCIITWNFGVYTL